MSVCPLEYRYGRDVMKNIWNREAKLEAMLSVEAALARAHAEVGNIPREAAEEIERAASSGKVTPERVAEIEGEIRHDIMALVKALAEQCGGDAGKYVHLGATSNDIIDTANALLIKKSLDVIRKDLVALARTLADRAVEHRDTVMLGRTHGQPAVPITLGLKLAVYAAEVIRHIERLDQLRPRICVGKMMGAVGTGAGLGEKAWEIQKRTMDRLGLGVEEAPTQIVGRDRYGEMFNLMALIASSLEKYATEVRNLQRPEIGEAAEAFDTGKQVGSSTMAHKKNPITSENICGLARVVRALAMPEMENMVTWHERDLTNSSSERMLLPHVFVLTDDILVKTEGVFRNLAVYPERMRENIEATKGLIMGERIMLALAERGMGRQEAHEVVRRAAMRAAERGGHLMDALLEDNAVASLMSREELEAMFDPSTYLGETRRIIDTIAERVKNMAMPNLLQMR
ncbi:MAG: adenylosuccinate lyase [Thermoplasmata archaeon]|nr:adenylosuccinate lyase [Thermoplasmata archaeon]